MSSPTRTSTIFTVVERVQLHSGEHLDGGASCCKHVRLHLRGLSDVLHGGVEGPYRAPRHRRSLPCAMLEHFEARAHQQSRTQHWLQRRLGSHFRCVSCHVGTARAGRNRCQQCLLHKLRPVVSIHHSIGRPTAAGGRADRTLDRSVDVLTSLAFPTLGRAVRKQ